MKKFVASFVLAIAIISNAFAGAIRVEVIEHKNNHVAVHFEVPLETSKVKIKITNTKTRSVMFTETVAHHSKGIIKYDLSQLPSGIYTVEVSTTEETVAKVVEVK
jgi:hypothetical protein